MTRRTALGKILKKEMHIFTYGTLMFSEVWQAVVGRPLATVQGTLRGYAIYRVRDTMFPGIAAANEDDAVEGVVYLNRAAQDSDTALTHL